MKPIKISEAAEAVGGKLVGNKEDFENVITGVFMDSRVVGAGDMFVAIKGERNDGHEFIASCFEKGASVALCEYVPNGVTGPCIMVENSVTALQKLASYYRDLLTDVKVIGVTGSVGKTSTKEIISGVLSARFRVVKSLMNHNNEIGLPLMVFHIEEDTQVAVLEMGISDFGEMRLLSSIAKPDICVITIIGEAHMEALGSRDGILKAKTEIFEYMNKDGEVFVNGDDDKLSTIGSVYGKPVHTYGFGTQNDLVISDVVNHGLEGSDFTANDNGHVIRGHINIPGRHMATNAALAVQISRFLGMTDEEIIKGLDLADTVAGRCKVTPSLNGFIIDDSYNASPTSMRESIEVLKLSLSGRNVAILGDMLELGKDEEKLHADVGTYAVSRDIDKLICVGRLSRNMYAAAKEVTGKSTEIVYYETTDELLAHLNDEVSAGDNVLIKASNGMGFAKVVAALKAR